MNNGLDTVTQIKATLIDLTIRFGPRLLVAILIVVLGSLAAGWVARGRPRVATLRSRASRPTIVEQTGARLGTRHVELGVEHR